MDKFEVMIFEDGYMSGIHGENFEFVKKDDLYAIEPFDEHKKNEQIKICEEIINLCKKLKEVNKGE